MFAVAVHTPKRHVQATLAPGGAVLFRPPGGEWAFSTASARSPHAESVDLLPVGKGIRLKSSVDLAGATSEGQAVDRKSETILAAPVRFVVGDTRFEVVDCDQRAERSFSFHRWGDANALSPAAQERWSEAFSTLARWPGGSFEFFRTAASLVRGPIGLDGAYVLTRDRNAAWEVAAAAAPRFEQSVWFDPRPLESLCDSEEGWLRSDGPDGAPSYAAVAWRDASGEVAGAVVGLRKDRSQGVRSDEAQLLRLLAASVANRLGQRQRLEERRRRRALIDQAFVTLREATPSANCQTFRGSGREVSLLVADLRCDGEPIHSTLSKLGPVGAFGLLDEALRVLTQPVLERSGVVVDYRDGGLVAMWNAPQDQPDHAARACEAGAAMVDAVAKLSDAWQSRLGRPLGLGVGVHSGAAVVGDTGLGGPDGHGVRGVALDLAERTARATQTLRVPLVVTEAARRRLSPDRETVRLGPARSAGVPDDSMLYTLVCEDAKSWIGCDAGRYAEALALLEARRFDSALRKLRIDADRKPTGAAAYLTDRILAARREQRSGARRPKAA